MNAQERHDRLIELERLMRELHAERRGLLTAEPLPLADRELQGWQGPVRLSELFQGRRDLLLVHNMGSGCPYCTLWADGFQGMLPHLENRAAFVVCSPDPPEVQRKFAGGRGWTFRMVHDPGGRTTRELGYLEERETKRHFLPGVSALRIEPDGSIRRVGHDMFGPGDAYCGLWHLFELLEGGATGWQPRFRYD